MSEPINSTISPWVPERDPVTLAVLGKLVEELNEASARAARCIIQGCDEIDPDTGRTNMTELEREVADVMACFEMTRERLGLFHSSDRQAAKASGFRRWHKMIEEGGNG